MEQPSGSLVTWTQAIYALHAFSLLTGILGAATVVGAFLTGWPSIIAVILNYVKRGEARGTWLESHFRWQIRTFWFGCSGSRCASLFVVVTLGIGIIIAWLPMGLVGLWFIYRIVRGWLALSAGRPMYTSPSPTSHPATQFPSYACCNWFRSSFCIWSIASNVRFDFAGSGSPSIRPRAVGTICHDSPNLSFSQPHRLGAPPSA